VLADADSKWQIQTDPNKQTPRYANGHHSICEKKIKKNEEKKNTTVSKQAK
jgi:hypothetical protein